MANLDFNTPGEFIKFQINKKDWTQEDFSQIIGLSLKHTNELLKGKENRFLTFEQINHIKTIFQLDEQTFIGFVELNIEYRNRNTEANQDIENKAWLYNLLPIGEMMKIRWLPVKKDFKSLFKSVNSIFGTEFKDLADLSNFLVQSRNSLSYRNISNENYNHKDNNRIAWYLFAKNKAEGLKNIPQYDKSKLRDLLSNICLFTNYESLEKGISEFLKKLNDCGVRFLFIPHLSKTYTEGAAFNCEFGPVIVLTGRTNKINTFWFNMAHEIIHILEGHYTQGPQIDTDSTTSKKDESENEIIANEGASNALKSKEIISHFRRLISYIQDKEIVEFSNLHNIHPSIVVGRLAWEGVVSFSILNRYKDTIKDKIPEKYKFGWS